MVSNNSFVAVTDALSVTVTWIVNGEPAELGVIGGGDR